MPSDQEGGADFPLIEPSGDFSRRVLARVAELEVLRAQERSQARWLSLLSAVALLGAGAVAWAATWLLPVSIGSDVEAAWSLAVGAAQVAVSVMTGLMGPGSAGWVPVAVLAVALWLAADALVELLGSSRILRHTSLTDQR